MLEIIRDKIKKIISDYNISDRRVDIITRPLSPQEAIGNPKHNDYPIIKGKERMLQATFNGSIGVAFTDMFGSYQSTLKNIVNIDFTDNFKRAIFVATINALLKNLNLIEKTIHCKNEELIECSSKLSGFIQRTFKNPKIFLCGLQPRFAEILTSTFRTKITDMDKTNIGKTFNGVVVQDISNTESCINWCDLIFATGSTFVNNTAEKLLSYKKNIVFYGVTGSGPSFLLGLNQYCPCGK